MNENDKVEDEDLAQLPKPIYQDHKRKKGVKKALTLAHETQKYQIDEEESKDEENECIGTSSRRRSGKSHLNDQTMESPLKKKKKKSSTKILVLQKMFVGTTTWVVDVKNRACKQTTHGKLK
jgi:hypothetical protein